MLTLNVPPAIHAEADPRQSETVRPEIGTLYQLNDLLDEMDFHLREVGAANLTKREQGELRDKLWRQDPHCRYCRRHVRCSQATLDHIIPRSAGGSNLRHNLVICCTNCNEMKANLMPRDFLHRIQIILENVRAIAGTPRDGSVGVA